MDFKTIKLSDFAAINMGQSPKSEFYNSVGDGMPFLQGNRTFGRLHPSFDTYTSKPNKVAETNDVIMSVRAPVGDLNIASCTLCLGRGVCSLKAFNGNQSFLFYLMKHYACDLVNRESGTVFGSVNRSDIANLVITVPSRNSDQQKIAAVLSALDSKIELNTKINNNLEQQAQALFKSWFIDFEPFGGGMPTDWEKGNLLDIANYLNGLAMQNFRPTDEEKGVPVLKIKELRQGFYDSDSELCSPNIKTEYLVNDGDVIFSWSGSLLVDFWCGGQCGLNQHLFKVTSKKYDKWFYYSWTKYYLERFIAIAADKATTMGHIKRDELKKAEIVIPSEKDYHKIGKVLKPIYDLIIQNRLENLRLSLLRDTLLPKLMSGEIDVSKVDISDQSYLDKLLFSEETE